TGDGENRHIQGHLFQVKKTGPRQLTRRRQRFFPVPERVSRLMLMIPCLKTELTLPTILLVLMSR
ncbi:hypothetical protein ACYQQU_005312, partial [Klebsiella pneumoniae]|uniref:hypothetical protein n=1 Tax=Klebsiella pneumoniae complex TaxID=3390273 RepID=UPI001C6FC7AF